MGAATHIKTSLYVKMANVEAAFRNLHQDLLDGCKNGDQKAQFQIYKLYYKAMYNTSLRIVSDTMEAEDIMQESFLDAFKRLYTYAGEGSFGSWLKRIVINNSLDSLRKEKDSISSEEEALDFPEIIEESMEYEIHLQVSEVKQAITKLPEDYRIVLTLFLLEG